jgi:hypothetical protein
MSKSSICGLRECFVLHIPVVPHRFQVRVPKVGLPRVIGGHGSDLEKNELWCFSDGLVYMFSGIEPLNLEVDNVSVELAVRELRPKRGFIPAGRATTIASTELLSVRWY